MKKTYKIITIVVAAATAVVSIYIMLNGLGLVDGLDFGAGAYYYADIPDYEKINADGSFHTNVPRWVHILLFLAWGWLMWRLWIWVENRGKSKK